MSRMPPIRFLQRNDPRAENSQELLEIAKTLAAEVFEKDGTIPPTFLFDNPLGEYTSAMQTTWANDDEKNKMAYTIREMFSQLGVERYGVVYEVFFSTVKVKSGTSVEEARRQLKYQPRNDPERREGVLMVVHDMHGGPQAVAMYIVERPKSEKPRLVLNDGFDAMNFIDMTFAPVPKVKH